MAGSKGLQIVIEPCCGRNSGLVHETHTLPGELLQSALVPSGRYQWLSDFWKDVSVISKILNVILNWDKFRFQSEEVSVIEPLYITYRINMILFHAVFFYSTQAVPQLYSRCTTYCLKISRRGPYFFFQELSLLPPGGRRLIFTGNLWLNLKGTWTSSSTELNKQSSPPPLWCCSLESSAWCIFQLLALLSVTNHYSSQCVYLIQIVPYTTCEKPGKTIANLLLYQPNFSSRQDKVLY